MCDVKELGNRDWLHPVKLCRERIMKKSRKFQIVYAGPTNLCQHRTTNFARGIMTNERTQSVLWKARSFRHSKTTSSDLIFNLSPTSR